jgi:hypothetical protein
MVMLRKLGEAAKRPGAHTQLMEVLPALRAAPLYFRHTRDRTGSI